jgi:hypothetical protein
MTRIAKVSLSQLTVYPNLAARDADRVKERVKLEGNPSKTVVKQESRTSSLVDEALGQYRKPRLTKKERAQLKDWQFRLNAYADVVQQHIRKRVSLMFMQAVVCYKTGDRFEEGHTIHQGRGANGLKVGQKTIPFDAAHSSTLPCLYVRSKATGEKTVHLYRSGLYDENNATLSVEDVINKADRAIDEMYADSLLREEAIKLLNKASKGKLTPEQVSKKFALVLIREIDKAIARDPGKKTAAKLIENQHMKDVLALYRDQAELLWSYVDHPEHIDRWLNVDLNDPAYEEICKSLDSLRKREPISTERIHQLIRKKIEALPVVIRQKIHIKENMGRAPNHFYDVFYLNLLQRFKGNRRALLGEILRIDYRELRERVQDHRHIGKTTALVQKSDAKIKEVVKEILPLLAYLRGARGSLDTIQGISEEKKTYLRPEIHKLRYGIILADQQAQSTIKKRWDETLQKKGINPGTQEESFALHSLFYHPASSSAMRTKFSKLFGVSATKLKQEVRELRVNRNAHNILFGSSSLISNISAKIDKKAEGRVTTAERIELKQQIDRRLHRMRSEGTPNNLKELYYLRLFDHIETVQGKLLLQKILGMDKQALVRKIGEPKRLLVAERTVKEETFVRNVRRTLVVAKVQMEKLTEDTEQFRTKLMRELRISHGMSQKQFKAIYRALYPHSPMSDGTMSNLENGLKRIDQRIVDQLSEIYGVRTGLFNPSHFAED